MVLFAAIVGLIRSVEAMFGCDISGGGSACVIAGLDLAGPLTSLAYVGGFGLFLLSPLLAVLALLAGATCAVRRRW
jgi:hypothetical protein